ncbi:hypothetical protein MNBD_NITROSPINAE02-1328 [hydrothermal vent metagenome]|uniref:Uncharacterized protein n=1 Tax=hydrothermal vent metagenome TaxID=652676 RepID=A0A3B1C034_9ZZZZ
MVPTLKDRMRHILNPLHLYCSLTHIMRQKSALSAIDAYERRFYNHLFPTRK